MGCTSSGEYIDEKLHSMNEMVNHTNILLRYLNQLVYNAWCVTYFSKEINYVHIQFKWGGLQWGLGQS